jgi:hypothetical protein
MSLCLNILEFDTFYVEHLKKNESGELGKEMRNFDKIA